MFIDHDISIELCNFCHEREIPIIFRIKFFHILQNFDSYNQFHISIKSYPFSNDSALKNCFEIIKSLTCFFFKFTKKLICVYQTRLLRFWKKKQFYNCYYFIYANKLIYVNETRLIEFCKKLVLHLLDLVARSWYWLLEF